MAKLRLRILLDGRPRTGEPFTLTIDDEVRESGTIPSDGNLGISIPPQAKKGKLEVGTGETKEIYNLNLGHLDPIKTTTGVKARLNNLGFDCGKVDAKMDDQTVDAIREFQYFINHPDPNGELDEVTLDTLRSLHDEER